MFATLADLVRENAHVIVECGTCGRRAGIEPFQLNEGRREPEALPEMETKAIADLIPKLRCKGYPSMTCGGRISEWYVSRKFSYGPMDQPAKPARS